MPLSFRLVQLDDQKIFKQIRQSCTLYNASPASETTFESVFCWAAGDFAQICVIDEGLIIFYEFPDGKKFFYPPLVNRKEDFVPVLRRMLEYSKHSGFNFRVERVTKEMAELAQDFAPDCRITPDRDSFEYLYNPASFISLEGGNYKSKRNLVHGFTADYDYDFVSYEPSMKKGVLDLVAYLAPVSDSYGNESAAIERALDNIGHLNLHCDVIKIDGRVIAFHIGYISEANVGVCCFEKGDTNYRGSYAAVTNFSSAKRFKGCTLINRQEDLGIEGLRTAKMSYFPIGFSEKYIIDFSKD